MAEEAKPAPEAKPLAGEWERVIEKAPFSPRDTAEGVVFNDKMWLSNGYGAGNVLTRDLWSSPDGENWTLVSDKTPYDGYAEMVVYQEKIWAIKGTVWNSADGANWTQVSEKTPFGVRGYGEIVVHDGKMWHLGSGPDVWWTTDGAQWTCAVQNAPFGNRYGSGVASFQGKLWLMGGALSHSTDPPEKHYPKYTTCNDVWYSTDGATWTRLAEPAPWEERMWTVATVYAGRLWLIGGFSNRKSINFDDAWATEDGKTWRQLETPTKFSPRHEPTLYVFQDRLWVVDGNSWPLMNDVWRLKM